MSALPVTTIVRMDYKVQAEWRRALAVQQQADRKAGHSPRGAANRVLSIGVSLYLRQALQALPPPERDYAMSIVRPLRSKPIKDARNRPSSAPGING